MVHPTVETAPVEYVAAVSEPSDLFVSLELVEADGAAAVGRMVVVVAGQVLELDHGQDFSDQEGGNGLEFGQLVGAVGPGNVGFEEIAKTQIGEEAGYKLSDETQKREGVE